ncbi:MAG: T9SS type A sorting domain-containing protein [Bacteroidetes bacterium]|nr:MAG: T9SS type A sorting domain-containing protein [Bacteroidota bacterium]
MKKTLFLFSLLCFWFNVSLLGQNLVPNPSFEEYSNCPDWENQIERADNWLNFGNTPDYFNSCASPIQPSYSTPRNTVGFQTPLHGSSYAGMLSYEDSTNYKEFIGSLLISPLKKGKKYYVSFNVSSEVNELGINCVSNGMGIKFSTVPYDQNNMPSLTNDATVFSNAIVDDTSNWVKLSGSFVADSNYSYVIIGNFFDDASINIQSIVPNNPFCGYAYFFVDDICVSEDSLTCNKTNEIIEKNTRFKISIDYNNYLSCESHNLPYDLELYDLMGKRMFYEEKVSENLFKVDLTSYETNVFIVKLSSGSNFSTFRIIKY